jgi:AraC-like DNA-binding protein
MAHTVNSGRVDAKQASARRAPALSRHCSNHRIATPVDRLLFSGPATAIGSFRCPVGHPAFGDSGPTERCIVVFPRTSVWIRHEGSHSFVADPNVVTIYNRTQRYTRAPLSPEGDRCDWFAVSDGLARDIAGAFDPAAADSAGRPFRFESAPTTPELYLAQRRTVRRAAAGDADTLRLEEAVVDIVSRVLAIAYGRPPAPLARRPSAVRRRRDLAEHARAELLRTMTVNRSVSDVAEAVGTSAFHLFRVFRAHTGRTMHEYRTELRLRAALELLGEAGGGVTLSEMAHRLGFSSHAHFVRICRRHLGAAPGEIRGQLRAAIGRATPRACEQGPNPTA